MDVLKCAKVTFKIEQSDQNIEVFTTRPDTIYGTSFLVLSPEHPLVNEITTSDKEQEVKLYQNEASKKSDLERTDLAKEKQVCLLEHLQLIRSLTINYLFG